VLVPVSPLLSGVPLTESGPVGFLPFHASTSDKASWGCGYNDSKHQKKEKPYN